MKTRGRPKKIPTTTPVVLETAFKEPDISIIFPSRGRVALLKGLLDSLIVTTSEIGRVEVLVAVDGDDVETSEFLQKYCSSSSFVKYFMVARSPNLSRDYYNFLWKHAQGKWVLAINDDCKFETQGWDTVLRHVLMGKDVVYAFVRDGLGASLNGVAYSCWPVLGRRGVETVGYFFPERVPMWGADIWAAKLYKAAGIEMVSVPIDIKHYCHHNGTREQDEVNKRVSVMSGVYSVEPSVMEISALKTAVEMAVN